MIASIILAILRALSKSNAGYEGVFLAVESWLVSHLTDDKKAEYWAKYREAKTLDDTTKEFSRIVVGRDNPDSDPDSSKPKP